MKIPTRSFLMDIGLVGTSVFVLGCLMQPSETVWIASVQRDDGTTASIRIDHPGNDENTLRQAILDDLVRANPKVQEAISGGLGASSGRVGFVRWQNETSQFYAQADADRLAPPPKSSPFQTASFPNDKNASELGDSRSDQWVRFWRQRSEQSSTWLAKYQSAQKQRLTRISNSLKIARLNQLFPARDGVFVAMAAGSLTIVVGIFACWCFPARTFFRGSGASLASDIDLNSPVQASLADNSSETASMAFRVGWVRLRQPYVVHFRRTLGWGIVLSAMIGVAGRLI